MNEWLVLTLNDHLDPVKLETRKTGGLAHQLALKVTDEGYRARVVDPEDAEEVRFWFEQVVEKRDFGYIGEYGHIPNGTRAPGDGCRTIGNMIYPAFGGMLEGSNGPVGENPNSASLPLSSNEIPDITKKISTNSGQYVIKIGGQVN